MDFSNRTVLITGAKRIGSHIAVELAARGADVAVSYCQSRDAAVSTTERIRASGRRALAVHANLCSPNACHALVQRVVDEFGRLDVLIAMASVYAKTKFEHLDPEAWAINMNVDLAASFFCAHAAAPHMIRQGGGRIIFFADSEAACGRPRHKGYLPYFVAKSGVVALGRALALELASSNVLVNTIALGPILPADDSNEEETLETARATPVGRWGGIEPISSAIAHLVESDFTTGEVLRVDGGRHLV